MSIKQTLKEIVMFILLVPVLPICIAILIIAWISDTVSPGYKQWNWDRLKSERIDDKEED